MKSLKEYRDLASSLVKEQSGTLAVIYLIFLIVTCIASFSIQSTQMVGDYELTVYNQPLSFITLIVTGPFALSFMMIANKINFSEKIKVGDILGGFKDFSRAICTYIVQSIYLSLWGLLYFLPSIICAVCAIVFATLEMLDMAIVALVIMAVLLLVSVIFLSVKQYSYSMCYFILSQDKSVSATESLKLSKEYTKGYKMKIFLLELSYFGWLILSAFTLGILSLWVNPKIIQAKYLLFTDIYEANGHYVENNQVAYTSFAE